MEKFCTDLGIGDMIRIEKKGTIDLDIVESNPIIFRGRLYLVEYIRQRGEDGAPSRSYHGNRFGKPYCRFRAWDDLQQFSAPFGVGYCFASAFAENDRIVVTVTERWGGPGFYLLESDDMEHWSEPRPIFSDPAKRCYNSSLFKADGRYVNALEIGSTADCLDNAVFFAESKDLVSWRMIPGASGRLAPPELCWQDGWYFGLALRGDYTQGFHTDIFRSRDLRTWEASPLGPVLTFGDEDRRIHPRAALTPEQRRTIAEAVNINNSDIGLCEYAGKLCVSYSWGDQSGHEFLALGEAAATLKEFCFNYFPDMR